MTFEIVGEVNKDRLYCTGSFTKMLTTFVCLSKLSEHYDLNLILDDVDFLDQLSPNGEFLKLFQKILGSKFSIRDLCTFYSGLPYTFDLSDAELESVDSGKPFKHHSLLDEKTFLEMCKTCIIPVHKPKSKFHYSEIAIIFLGYLIEKVYQTSMEQLYQKYVIQPFGLKRSFFSRTKVDGVAIHDLSDRYDYPAIAIMDHGYFCYSNGYFTTLNDQKQMLEKLIHNDVFKIMCDFKKSRAASKTIMNGLTVEVRKVGEDLIYGYEGLSYSGCNLWAYSTQKNKGYLTTNDDEEAIYPLIYDKFGYSNFDNAPPFTQELYLQFLKTPHEKIEHDPIPTPFIGTYKRVKINDKSLDQLFYVHEHSITIRNPEEITYPLVFVKGTYRVLGKDNTPSQKVGFYTSKSDHHYMFFDGNLYKQIF